MSERFPVVECSIETLDRTLYASRELGDLVDTGDYILNTALYYALGFASGKYINQGNKPSYLEDTRDIYKKFYITPARPELTRDIFRVLGIQTTNNEKIKALPKKLGDIPQAIGMPVHNSISQELEGNRYQQSV